MSADCNIIQGDALTVLKTLPSESVHCCVTSPPYWGLRDYGVEGQLGLERTPEEYVAKMVEVFREVRRVLREDGTLWCNLGDAYNSPNTHTGKADKVDWGIQRVLDAKANAWIGNRNLKPKDLLGMPWRLAFALQADGWWLRQDIIWSKPGPMPESVRDRCCKSHEYVFLLAKSERYFFDQEAIKEPAATEPHNSGYVNGAEYAVGPMDRGGHSQREDPDRVWAKTGTRIKRSVWTINSEAYPESHFATFPTALVKPCILSGTSARGCCPKCGSPWERVVEATPEYAALIGHSYHDHKADGKEYAIRQQGKGPLSGDQTANACPNGKYTTTGWRPTCSCGLTDTVPCVVLDPFFGSGTVGQVALELGRRCIGVELNPAYVELARKRTNVTPGLQLA